MMDSADKSSKTRDEKSRELEYSGDHHNHPGHSHRNNQYYLFDKLPKLFTLVFSAATLVACLVLYNSAYTFQFFPSPLFNPSFSSPGSATRNLSYSHESAPGNLSLSHESAVPGNLSSSHQSAPGNLSSSHESNARNLSSLVNEDYIKLETILKKAATVDKTVIITALNEAWATPNSIFDLFLESFRIGNQTERLLKHLVVIALDQKAYTRCLELHPFCYSLVTPGIDFSNEAYYMSPTYFKMMWRRLDFLRTVLDIGYNFIFSDTDIMWFRDPFVHFYSNADFQIACDHFVGDPLDLNNSPNGGFKYVISSNRTIEFYKFWYASRERYPGQNEQDVLNMIKFDPFVSKLGLQMRFLDTSYFGGFCEHSKDLNLVCTMHANCCTGLDTKIYELKLILKDWKRFMSSLTNGTQEASSWTPRQRCR